jgi:hypothetical protein
MKSTTTTMAEMFGNGGESRPLHFAGIVPWGGGVGVIGCYCIIGRGKQSSLLDWQYLAGFGW